MAAAEHEDNNCSSYGSMESEEEGVLGMRQEHVSDALLGRLENIQSSIVGMNAKQSDIVEKLASLEKVVMAMQKDTTWVREDLAVVHEVMEKLCDHVCELSKTRTEPDGVGERRSPDVSPWGTWKDDATMNEREEAGITTNMEEAVLCLGDEEPSHIRGGQEAACSIRETQMHDMYSGMHVNTTTSMDDGRMGRWYENRATSPGLCSPPRKQTRRTTEEPAVDEEVEQVDVTVDDTQLRTEAPRLAMWVDFKDTLKDIPGHGSVGSDGEEGWVRAKRARDRVTDQGGVCKSMPTGTAQASHGNLNLNFSPEKVHGGDDMRGRGGRGRNSMGGGEGGGDGVRDEGVDV